MVPTKHTLYDDFTIKGKFWLPPQKRKKPKKIDGILQVSAGKNIALELFGDFAPFTDAMGRIGDGGEAGKPPLIYGQTDSGQEITLFDSFWTNRQYGSAGHVRSDYTSNLCIIGAWFEGEDDVKFGKMELTLTHLESWLGVDPFNSERILRGEEQVGAKFTYMFHDDLTVEIPDPKLTFKLVAHLMPESKRHRSVTLVHTSAVELTPAAPLSFEATFQLMADVQKFFTLMVGEQVFVRKLRGWTKVRDSNPRATKAARKVLHDAPCDVFFYQFDLREPRDLMTHRMTMPYGAIMNRFPQALLNWFASLPRLRPVYDVFFATYRAGRMFGESHFLHLSQAVESFDRRMNGGQYMSDAEYDEVYKALVAAIPLTTPDGLRQKLKGGTLMYANEFSLRKRLTDMLKAMPKGERDLICEQAGELAGPVVDTRNNLTHVLGEPKPDDKAEVLKAEQLRHAANKLELLLVILLLKNLGLPSDVIVNRVTECQRFDTRPFKG